MLREDIRKTLRVCALFVLIFIAVKWTLPLVWPIAIGWCVAKILAPIVEVINRKFKISLNIGAIVVMILFVIIASMYSD